MKINTKNIAIAIFSAILVVAVFGSNLQVSKVRAEIPVTPVTPVDPTPTIIDNNAPKIQTRYLKRGRVGRSYETKIKGVDSNAGDVLNINAVGLPEGLELSTCKTRSASGRKTHEQILCKITGIAQNPGIYEITITIQDDKGATDTKILKLQIK